MGNGSFAIAPTPPPGQTAPRDSFSMVAVPGQQFAESVSVANLTAAPLQLLLYPADAYTIRNGGVFAVTALNVTTRDVGAWVSKLPRAVTVPPRKQLNVSFTLRVPANATPGTHAGGIVAQAAVPQRVQVNGTMQSLVYQQVFTRIYVTVSGRLIPNFTIDSLEVNHPQPPIPLITHRSGSITYFLSNTGNAIIEPRVRVQVTGWSGTVMDRTVPATGQLLPGNIAQYNLAWPRVPAIGPVRVRLTVQSGYGLTRTADYNYLALPYPFLDISALFIVAIAVAILLRIRRNRRRRQVTE
ncbi:MAG TPA: DUF916 domain-containing protein [Rugosimonospora sp.]|nr:DUF916 domain-containing protein [Rugosimonospora sp.]